MCPEPTQSWYVAEWLKYSRECPDPGNTAAVSLYLSAAEHRALSQTVTPRSSSSLALVTLLCTSLTAGTENRLQLRLPHPQNRQGLKEPAGSSSSIPPCHGQEHFSLEQDAHSHIQPGFNFQGWSFHVQGWGFLSLQLPAPALLLSCPCQFHRFPSALPPRIFSYLRSQL